MRSASLGFSNWTVGSKITAFTFALVGAILAALIVTLSWTTSSLLHERAVAKMQSELRGVLDTVGLFNKAMSAQAVSYERIFATGFEGDFGLDEAHPVTVGANSVPLLTVGGKPLNLDFTLPDRFTHETGGNATIFVAAGDDFVRISTSVKKENGERAVGTALDRASPAYAAVHAGKPYIGLATLFGKQFVTDYEPVRDASGRVVGVLYVGVDVGASIQLLKDRIKTMKVGETGYFYVLDATPGPHYGALLIHPSREGQNLLDSRDADGRLFIREMLEKKSGLATYPWQDTAHGDTGTRPRIAVYDEFKDWHWLIVGSTYEDELSGEATRLRDRTIAIGLLALALFAAILHAVMKRVVSRPLDAARDAAVRIAQGDLTVRLTVARQDEIGLLAEAMNRISSGLSEVVGQVRSGAEQIAAASGQISAGNLDLCARTERQAASLANTANTMGALTETVRQNAGDARQANQLAVNTSMVAQEGGRMVAQVVDTMDSIKQSSGRIKDIIGVIDGIAFQTNILALNAAVEAARAGEQGRGFAVVATEVRNLAQRSAAAAREVKALIEASTSQVDAGSRVVEEAGVTMQEVLASANQVTAIMARISEASTAQSTGIEGVNGAIGEMDRVTQQNAALVEQASGAAQAMQQQAGELAQAVRVFKLDATAGPAPRQEPQLVLARD
jgi:methyl-accepting chemotaxis protein-2 (aspartate sensor receptor)